MTQDARAPYDETCAELTATSEATASTMFGMPCLKIGRKAFAGFHAGAMVFKLRGSAHAEALALPGSALFDPTNGRPMREWVVVQPRHAGRWVEFGRQALAYVGGQD